MNCKQANEEIKIVDFLLSQGMEPARIYRSRTLAWYKSPYREDKKPSFKVYIKKNRWFDLGTNEGGTLIDLVMKMFNCDTTGALAILDKPEIAKTSFSFSKEQKEDSHGIEIVNIQPLNNWILKQYLIERNIDFELVKNYLVEVRYNTYKDQEKPFFALGFKNNKDGYELRSKTFKGSSYPKYFTIIPGMPKRLNVFEGFIDYLSALTKYNTKKLIGLTIVLNSTGNTPYIEQLVKSSDLVNCFLDNDPSGEKAFEIIQNWNTNTINQAQKIYPGYNDFNDFICNKPMK